MSFKQFLGERTGPGGHRQSLDEAEFVEALKHKARNSYTIIKKSPLFIHAEGSPFFLLTPGEKPGRSTFWLDRLASESHKWSRYPNREKCIRAYTDVSRVGDGEVYVVIPLDGSRVGVCSERSFYKSFKGAEKTFELNKLDNEGLEAWLKMVVIGLNKIGADIPETDLDSYADFKKKLRTVDKALQGESRAKMTATFKAKRDEMDDKARKVLGDLLTRHVTDIETYLNEKLDPESNGFSTIKIESMHKFTEDREIWISDPVLLIAREKYIDLHKRGVVT